VSKAESQSFLAARRDAYKATYLNPPGQRVLKDLAKFCRALESTFNPDPHIAAKLDGRREVFLRIQSHLQLTDDELWSLYGERK